jgi:hypothetical protein
MWIGWLVLVALTALAVFAAVAVGLRAAPSGRAELAVVASLVFFALLGLPTLALGYADVLSRATVGGLVLATSAAAIGLASRGCGFAEHGRATVRALGSLLRLPLDAILEATRARSAVVLGLLWCTGLLALAFWLTYLAPSETWDGLFYHEPIVGFAIQNHGFSAVALPQHQAVQATNGYAKLGESVSLWFVVFTDKTFIELPNTLAAPALVFALYVVARRAGDRLSALAWAPVLVLVPAVWTQLRTTYVDVEVAFFVVAAVHFATRPTFRIRDALLAGLAMTLFAGTKLSALAWAPPMVLLTCARTLVVHRRRWGAAWLAALSITTGVAGVTALTLVHDWRAFHDPIWPMGYDNAALGIHWKGLNTLAELAPHVSLANLVATKYGAPIGGMPDIHDRDYGYAVPWIVVPFAALGVLRTIVGAARELRSRRLGAAGNLLLVFVIGAFSVIVTPSIFPARYNVHIVAIAMVAATAGLSGARWLRAREGVLVAATAMSIVPLYWTRGWYFGMTPKRMVALMSHSASERAYMNSEDFDVPERVAKKREAELGPGDRVAFTGDVLCPGALWNDRFSNRIAMVPFDDARGFLARIDAYAPKWIVVAEKGAARQTLDHHPETWEYVGPGTAIDSTAMFRRRPSSGRPLVARRR